MGLPEASQDGSGVPSPILGEETNSNSTQFNWAVPTEVVPLPSKGLFYPEGHPLHRQETVEIKYMTAKEEDLLTSQSLLREGQVDRDWETTSVGTAQLN